MIREARSSRGWSQQRLADELGTVQSAVHRIENGQQNLSLSMIGRLAEARALIDEGLRLGPRILRTETAGLAAIAALQAMYGDLHV